MRDIIVIGDLHGRVEVVRRALEQDADLIFVGDYLDSRSRGIYDQLECFTQVACCEDHRQWRSTP